MAYTSKFSGTEIDTKLDDLTIITDNLNTINDNTAAYVTSFTTTTSGDTTWYIKKYNTGITEAYGIIPFGDITCSTLSGGTKAFYYYNSIVSVNFPSGIFKTNTIPAVTVNTTEQAANGGYCYIFSIGQVTATQIKGWWYCPYNQAHNITLFVHAVGESATG